MMRSAHMHLSLKLALFLAVFGLWTRVPHAQPAGTDMVYRIVVQDNATEKEAGEFKLHLESLGFVPIILSDFKDGRATVYYGNFLDNKEAERARKELLRNAISAISIVKMKRNLDSEAGGSYTILVSEFKNGSDALKLKADLEKKGHFDVQTRKKGDSFVVTIGTYPSKTMAQNVVAGVKNDGYGDSKVIDVALAGAIARVDTAPPSPAGAKVADVNVGDIVSQTGLNLTPQQKEELVKMVEERFNLQKQQQANPNAAIVERLSEIEKKMSSIDTRVTDVINRFDEEVAKREEGARKTVQVASLLREADQLARAKKYDEAISKTDEVLKLDPNNTMAPLRKKMWEDIKINGPDPMGSAFAQQYARLKDEAVEAEKINEIDSLVTARSHWGQIKALDKSYEDEANQHLSALVKRIDALRKTQSAAPPADLLPLYLIGSVLFIVIVLAVVFFVMTRRRHREMMAKIQEATAMRPMRGIPGAGDGNDWMLGGPGGGELPSPQGYPPQGMAPMQGGHPGMAGAPPMTGAAAPFQQAPPPMPPQAPPPQHLAQAPTSQSPVYSPEATQNQPYLAQPQPAAQQSYQQQAPPQPVMQPVQPQWPGQGPDGNPGIASPARTPHGLDLPSMASDSTATFGMVGDLFAEPSEKQERAQVAASRAVQQQEDNAVLSLDDILGDTTTRSEPPPEAAPQPAAAVAQDAPYLAPLATPPPRPEPMPRPLPVQPAPQPPQIDLPGMESTMIPLGPPPNLPIAGLAPASAAPAPPASTVVDASADPFAGSPFEDILGAKAHMRPAPAPAAVEPSSGAAIAPLQPRRDVSGNDPFAALGLGGDFAEGAGEETIILNSPSADLPEMSTLGRVPSPANDDTMELKPPPGGPSPAGSGSEGLVFMQTFDQDPVGKQPTNWQGEYAYSTLTVQDSNPPEGSHNYLAYQKTDGVGKVYYFTKFPNTSGILNVEFDLRCNDKNKFLLGFYIEKDEDFQQSIHTKILRSEAQTAPSIHIHGQPAPYMLGQWVHIRYLIDLNEGKVDGFVDGRPAARSIPLTQVPKYLNTLSIRDNINTTGTLFVDNIKIQKVG